MRASSTVLRLLCGAAALVVLAPGCSRDAPPGRTFYEREIEPILIQTCAGNTAGCHATNADDQFAFAAGNLDVTSFENVQKRRDLLQSFGAYPVPGMLIKAVGTGDTINVDYNGTPIPLQIAHSGGNIFTTDSEAFQTLLRWMENGATENGVPPPDPPQDAGGDCSTIVPAEFDPQPVLDNPAFGQFESDVQPVLNACSSGNCHGAQQADFYVTCGTDDTQLAFNFTQAQAFIRKDGEDVSNSQILRVPLSISNGGYFHSGGEHFSSRQDQGYLAIEEWAIAVGGLDFGANDPGRQFFADNVQPVLLQRGCSFEGCHSPSATNDLKLRSGSQGFFSPIALERNYDLLRNEFLALEMPDARRGRAVAKSIIGAQGGIEHRGGAVLGSADPNDCDPVFDPATATPFCVIQEWINIERAALLAAGEATPMGAGDIVPMVYIDRQASHVAELLAVDTFQAGSDLRVANLTLGADGSVVSVGAPQSLLASCGVSPANVDVRSPDVRGDGITVAFAMRTSAADTLGIYTVGIDGAGCQRITPQLPDQNGIKIHDFDPAWAPDGETIVFASTRGAPSVGPSLSRADFRPQSDIWRMDRLGGNLEQVTFLTNSEISPQFMREGRVIMTTEKVSDGFYQLSGRRINWDLTDYHPLLAQRAESPFASFEDPSATLPSVGYAQATEIREGTDGNFLLILSDRGARGGAGTLGVFNRSVGTFELGRNDPGFLPSLAFPDPAASGRADANSAYRSPFPLPDGRILAAYATGISGGIGNATSIDWDIVAVNRRTGAREVIIGGAGAQLEAVLAIRYPQRRFFFNRRQLVFGGGVDTELTGGLNQGVVHFPDAPLVFTLLNANLRRGRPVDLFRAATQVVIYEERPTPTGTTSGNLPSGIFQDRVLLGSAPLAEDGSARIRVPAGRGIILELQDDNGNIVETMREEHQFGPGEVISMGISADLFDSVCGGCHGSVSGRELDISVSADALTGASESLSAESEPVNVTP